MTHLSRYILLLLISTATAFNSVCCQAPADPLVDSLLRDLSKAKNDSSKVKLYMELGNNVGYYDATKARGYAQAGMALSDKINYPLGSAHTRYLLGNTYLDLGDYTNSKIFF